MNITLDASLTCSFGLNTSSLPVKLAKLFHPPHSTPLGRVCGAYEVSRVTCYAQSPDMKIGLTGLASKIGVYSHEQGSRKRGVQLSNSAFMACRHHRHHRYHHQQCINIAMVVIIFVTAGRANKEVVP